MSQHLNTSYDRYAGRSVERLAALSDGIFGVAMTLLLLDLHTPAEEAVAAHGLTHEILALVPLLLVYLMSFITLGIFWVGQQAQLSNLERSDRHYTWLTLAFLFAVTLMPFSTRLLQDYVEHRSALVAYWLNLLLLGVMVYACWGYANRAKLVKEEVTQAVRQAICHRVIIGQGLYAFGALLCLVNTYVSIGFIILAQLNFAVAPRWWRRVESDAPAKR
jgi:uncharacterized membrane protein